MLNGFFVGINRNLMNLGKNDRQMKALFAIMYSISS
ncbi:hypothetical protein PAAL109150_14315 [Paenibacillus alkaliterrae]